MTAKMRNGSSRMGLSDPGLIDTARRNSLSWVVSSDETATPFLLPAKKMPVSAPRAESPEPRHAPHRRRPGTLRSPAGAS